jgi:transposase
VVDQRAPPRCAGACGPTAHAVAFPARSSPACQKNSLLRVRGPPPRQPICKFAAHPDLIGDKDYDSSRFRQALAGRGIVPCIPSCKSRKVPILHHKTLYRQRHRIENMFGRLKDWRRIAMRYDRCAHIFFSAIALASTVLFWINEGAVAEIRTMAWLGL